MKSNHEIAGYALEALKAGADHAQCVVSTGKRMSLMWMAVNSA